MDCNVWVPTWPFGSVDLGITSEENVCERVCLIGNEEGKTCIMIVLKTRVDVDGLVVGVGICPP